MRKHYMVALLVTCLSGIFGMPTTSPAAMNFDFDVTVRGVDAIFLAGQGLDDLFFVKLIPVPIPIPNGDPNAFILLRHDFLVPEFPLTERVPPSIPIVEGATVKAVERAIGGVSFFNGFNGPIFGPDGNEGSESDLSSPTNLGGISGYKGPQGALVGVFLDDSIPGGEPPPTLDFTPDGLGTNFTSLEPSLGQVFFIGDGFIDDHEEPVSQRFIAPAGATRLVLGIPDGFDFQGQPGAYEDNNGAYLIRVRVSP
jgi:hypothetical protein